jgi:hypothetical protein
MARGPVYPVSRITKDKREMETLIWVGAAVTLLGLAGLIWCIVRVRRARAKGLGDDALRAELQKVVALNLGALLLSAFGLMLVVVGIFLS